MYDHENRRPHRRTDTFRASGAGLVGVFGIAYGAVIALSAPVVAEICGSANIGRNVGVLMGARAARVLLGPWSVGFAQWRLGSYTWPLIACSVVGIAAAACMARSGVATPPAWKAVWSSPFKGKTYPRVV